MYYISIYFDQKTTNRLQDYINQAAKKSGNTFMSNQNVPPHITISAFASKNEKEIIKSLEKTFAAWEQGTVQWVSVGAFLPHVIYLAPVLNQYLQELSVAAYESIQQAGNTNVHPCYYPMHWMPHTTIGKTLEKEQMRAAFQVLQESFGIFTGTAVQIGLAKTNPFRNLALFEFINPTVPND